MMNLFQNQEADKQKSPHAVPPPYKTEDRGRICLTIESPDSVAMYTYCQVQELSKDLVNACSETFQ